MPFETAYVTLKTGATDDQAIPLADELGMTFGKGEPFSDGKSYLMLPRTEEEPLLDQTLIAAYKQIPEKLVHGVVLIRRISADDVLEYGEAIGKPGEPSFRLHTGHFERYRANESAALHVDTAPLSANNYTKGMLKVSAPNLPIAFHMITQWEKGALADPPQI